MTYYFTSEKAGIEKISSGEEKLSPNKMIAAFCLANPLEEPYYWFPCDFGSDGTVQYHELFENAFKESTEGKKGFVYSVEAEEEDLSPEGEILDVFVPNKELYVTGCEEINDLFGWLMEEEDMGRFRLYGFESATRQKMLLWHNSILRYLSKNKMMENPKNPYAEYIREKLPAIWEKYEKLCGK